MVDNIGRRVTDSDASASALRSRICVFVVRLVYIISFIFFRRLMGDKVKALRKENDDLKRQLNNLKKCISSLLS